MISTAPSVVTVVAAAPQRERVSFRRLAWVSPLTVMLALVANAAISFAARSLDPSLARAPQLQTVYITFTMLGAVAAVVVFALLAALTRRPLFWFTIAATVGLVLSWIPDLTLLLGGQAMATTMRLVGPLTSLGVLGSPGRPAPGSALAGGPPPGGFPAGGLPAASLDLVLVLMLMHLATAAVCVLLLRRLTPAPTAATTGTES